MFLADHCFVRLTQGTIDAKERDVAMTCVLLVLCSLEYYSLNLIYDADTNAEMLDLHGAVVPVGVLDIRSLNVVTENQFCIDPH